MASLGTESNDGTYEKQELTKEEKVFVKETMKNLINKLMKKINLFIEVYVEDGLGSMRKHLHSKWGFSGLGTGDYMILGFEEVISVAISEKLMLQYH